MTEAIYHPSGNAIEMLDLGADIGTLEHETIFWLPALQKFDVDRYLLVDEPHRGLMVRLST